MLTWLNQRAIGQQILFLLLLIFIPCFAILAWFLATDLESETNEAHEKIRIFTSNTAAIIERDLKQNETLLLQMSSLASVRAMDRENCDTSLNVLGKMQAEYVHLAMIDQAGKLSCSFHLTPPSQNLIDHEKTLRNANPNAQLITSGALFDKDNNRWVALKSYPVLHETEARRVGVVILVLDLVILSQEIFNNTPEMALTGVVDQQQVLLLRSKQASHFIGRPMPSIVQEAILKNYGGILRTTSLDGVEYLTSQKHIPGSNWVVLAGLPEDLVFAEHQRVVRASLFIILPAFFLTISLAWWVGRKITAPISTLANTAQAIASGDRTSRAPCNGPVEIVAVAKQLNQILDLRDEHEASLVSAVAFSRTILNSMNAEIAVLNFVGEIIMLNDAWQACQSSSATDASALAVHSQIGQNYLEENAKLAANNRHAQKFNLGVHKVLSGEQAVFYYEYPAQTKQQRWFQFKVTPHNYEAGGVVIFHSDISERKQSEVALRQSQELLDNIINSTPSTIFALDSEHRFTMLNDATAKFFGIPKAEVLGKSLAEVFPPSTVERFKLANEKILHDGEVFFGEEIVTLKDGDNDRLMITSKFPLRDMHGKITGIAGVATDITEFHAAREALRKREAQNQALISAIPDTIFINKRDGQYLKCYNGKTDTLLLSPEHFLLKKIPEVLPSEIATICMQGIHSAIEQQTRQEVNYTLKLDEQERHYEARIVPFGEDTALSIVRDVTAHKEVEIALLASVKEKMGLLNEVHHRVKNNLQIVFSLLRLEAGRSNTAETKAILTDMQNRIGAMALLHESLYMHGAYTSVNLNEYLQQLANQIFSASVIEPNAISLQFSMDTVRVSMDQATPCGLLVNELLTNCLQHAFPDGRSGQVALGLRKISDDGMLCLSIADNGIGIAAEIFQMKRKSLGMQLVHDLARQLKGTLECQTTNGTSYQIRFKADETNNRAVHTSQSQTPQT